MKQAYRKLSALILALALCLSLSVPALAAEETGLDPSQAPAVAKELGGASQIAWAVWQDGEITASGGLGGTEKESYENSALYGLGSVSKIYTTVAVMRLAEQGKLSLDQPVTKYLPEFKMADGRYKDITVRMLLNHSSGLMGSTLTSGVLFDDASTVATDLLLERLATQRLKADPGAYSVYCNDGFTLAELVVEAVSGMDFEDYLQKNIFEPAGLRETYTPAGVLEEGVKSRTVPIYQGDNPAPLPMDCLGIVGAGGLYATAADLAAFGGALTGTALLKASSLDAMAAPEYAKGIWPEGGMDALAYGLGWDSVEWYPFSQSGITALVKGGDTQYYHSGLVVLPEYQMAAAVVSSGGVSTYNEMAASQLLIAALAEEGVSVDKTPLTLPEAKPAAMPAELTALSGYYASLYVYKVEVNGDGKLTMHHLNMPNLPDLTFTYYSDGSFRDEKNTASLRLVREDNGQMYLRQKTFTQIPGLGGLPGDSYAAMRLPEHTVSQELQEYWGKLMTETAVLPMNERYSSQVYPALASAFGVAAEQLDEIENAPGYIGALQIVDENHARYVPQVPGTAGRDGYDLEFKRDENGVLWMYQSNGSVAMDMEAVPELSAGKDNYAICTVQPNGYTRWYRIGEKTAGKTMTVQWPDGAGFWAYDSKGALVASSVMQGSTSVELPEDGLVAFAGDPGAQFQIAFQ